MTSIVATATATDSTKATPKEIREFFGPDAAGQLMPLVELKDLKLAEGKAHAIAYDDIALGIGDGTLTY